MATKMGKLTKIYSSFLINPALLMVMKSRLREWNIEGFKKIHTYV